MVQEQKLFHLLSWSCKYRSWQTVWRFSNLQNYFGTHALPAHVVVRGHCLGVLSILSRARRYARIWIWLLFDCFDMFGPWIDSNFIYVVLGIFKIVSEFVDCELMSQMLRFNDLKFALNDNRSILWLWSIWQFDSDQTFRTCIINLVELIETFEFEIGSHRPPGSVDHIWEVWLLDWPSVFRDYFSIRNM